MQFIVDTQLPPSLSEFLAKKGYNVIHTIFFPDDHLLKDHEIVQIAIAENRTVITKDRHFFGSLSLTWISAQSDLIAIWQY